MQQVRRDSLLDSLIQTLDWVTVSLGLWGYPGVVKADSSGLEVTTAAPKRLAPDYEAAPCTGTAGKSEPML